MELINSNLKEQLKTEKSKVLNVIYSDKLLNSKYSNFYVVKNILPSNICNYYIEEINKNTLKLNTKTNMHELSINKIPILIPYVKNIINRNILNKIEEKYELLPYQLEIVEIYIMKINNDTSQYKNNNDFTINIVLNNTEGILLSDNNIINLNNINIGDVIIYNSNIVKQYKNIKNDLFVLCSSIKYMGGYDFKYNHNKHPNENI
jgi:hypothetical protein